MKTMTYRTVLARSSAWARGLTLATLAAGAWGLSASNAHARGGDDVYWSIGVHQPGVSVGVSNAPPPRAVVVQPQPVLIYQPTPVVVQEPYPRYYPPHYPYVRPVIVQPQPVVIQPRWGHDPRWEGRYERRHWRHWNHHRHERRHDRDDD